MNGNNNKFYTIVLFCILVGTGSTAYSGWQGWTAWASAGLDGAKQTVLSNKQAATKNIHTAVAYIQSVLGSINASCMQTVGDIKQVTKAHPYETYLALGVFLGAFLALRLNKKKKRA